MKINEDIARYFLQLQKTSIGEIGESEEDKKYREMIYNAFPNLKRKAEEDEFDDWLWRVKIEENDIVKDARLKFSFSKGFSKDNISKYHSLKHRLYKELINNREELMKEFKTRKAIDKLRESK